MYDVHLPRLCYGTTMVTNWMGDDAFLREISIVARRANAYGDVTWINGEIVEKYQQGQENLVKIVLVYDNQHWRHSWGHAVVSLPSRDRGPAPLLPLPPNPENEPYTAVPEDVKSSLYRKDPGLPYGSRFKSRE